MNAEERIDQLVENLYRLHEFRAWVQTNVLFPMVPDTVVHPLVDHLKQAERTLVGVLYENNALDRVASIHKTLQGAR